MPSMEGDIVIPSSSLSRYLDLKSLKAELDCLPEYNLSLRVYIAEPIPVKRVGSQHHNT